MGDVTQVSTEMIQGHRVVRSFGGEAYESKRFLKASQSNFRQSLKLVKTSAIHTPVLQLIVGMALAFLIYLALTLMQGWLDWRYYLLFDGSNFFCPKPIRQLSEVSANIQKGIAAAESVFEVLDEVAEEDNGQYQIVRVQGRLDVRNLSFTYPGNEKLILSDINFTAKSGQTIALVGSSGSGKSTLASLISRFYDYKHGQIYLDGVDIREYTLKNLRQQIAFCVSGCNLI